MGTDDFTHLQPEGGAHMVDVSAKTVTSRTAVAQGEVHLQPATFAAVQNRQVKKGDVLEVARIAGIMAAKKTPDLIPLCHPLAIRSVSVNFEMEESSSVIRVIGTVKTTDVTGVEMEALTAVSVACLTIYDMIKGLEKGATIGPICLLEKSGGKSGPFTRGAEA